MTVFFLFLFFFYLCKLALGQTSTRYHTSQRDTRVALLSLMSCHWGKCNLGINMGGWYECTLIDVEVYHEFDLFLEELAAYWAVRQPWKVEVMERRRASCPTCSWSRWLYSVWQPAFSEPNCVCDASATTSPLFALASDLFLLILPSVMMHEHTLKASFYMQRAP